MPGTLNHLDDFTLLRHVARDLNDIEAVTTRRHLRTCGVCQENLEKIEELDHALREAGDDLLGDAESEELPAGDPFRHRPSPRVLTPPRGDLRGPAFAAWCLEATKLATSTKDHLLSCRDVDGEAFRAALDGLKLAELADRYALGYALDEAVPRIVEGPARWLRFARAAIARLAVELRSRSNDSAAEFAYPLRDLVGRAHLVAGVARNWTGEFEEGGRDLLAAYRSFTRGAGSEVDLARVELAEAQRRSFVERAREGLLLAARAEKTFTAFGIEDDAARAQAARGLALSTMGREEEALQAYRLALPTLQRLGLWNNYVTTLQNIGSSLTDLGRLDEARREYARALTKVSRSERPAVHAFIRLNLARILLEAGRYAQAATAFGPAASLFEQQGAHADALMALLFRIECLARMGATARAAALLTAFRERVEEHQALDPSTLKALEAALAGRDPDFASLARLRNEVEETLRDRLGGLALQEK